MRCIRGNKWLLNVMFSQYVPVFYISRVFKYVLYKWIKILESVAICSSLPLLVPRYFSSRWIETLPKPSDPVPYSHSKCVKSVWHLPNETIIQWSILSKHRARFRIWRKLLISVNIARHAVACSLSPYPASN